jgi:hypothetical protein
MTDRRLTIKHNGEAWHDTEETEEELWNLRDYAFGRIGITADTAKFMVTLLRFARLRKIWPIELRIGPVHFTIQSVDAHGTEAHVSTDPQ